MAEGCLRPVSTPALFWFKVEHHSLKKQLAKLKSSGTQSVQLGVLLSRMNVLVSPDFNPQKDNLWKEMIEAAQAEPEEKVWEIF